MIGKSWRTWSISILIHLNKHLSFPIYHHHQSMIKTVRKQRNNTPNLSSEINFICLESNPDEMRERISTRILLMMIKWLHHSPTFSNLTIHDQVFSLFWSAVNVQRIPLIQLILLQESWSELFLLSLVENVELIEKTEPNFRQRFIEIDDQFRHFSTLLHQYRLDAFEYTCLKLIVLFRPGKRRASDRSKH